MKVIHSISEYKQWRNQNTTKTVGFVPTMGALHYGHEELLKKSKLQTDLTVLSIFVNPTQFNDKTDFEKYPIQTESDLEIAQKNNVDIVFLPKYAEIYSDNYRFKISESELSNKLCGAHRPGHFNGVLTIVMKLFQIIKPNKTFFGEKDFQQFLLIKDMSKSFFLDLEVIGVPTVREANGLALSSRNQRLTPEQKELASNIYKTISKRTSKDECLKELTHLGFKVEYLEDLYSRRFVAVQFHNVRLIDNVTI